MTITDYEKQGGFKEELLLIREIGQRVTTLLDRIPARPHRGPEITAAVKVSNALDALRHEIVTTRNG